MKRVKGLWRTRKTSEDDEDYGDSLDSLIRILKKPSYQRSSKNLASLLNFSEHIKFFRQLAEELSEDAVTQCCLHMSYEFVEARKFVFEQGDVGGGFYVILEGDAAVVVTNEDTDGNYISYDVAQYNKGDSFGELSLLTNKPRAASIYCNSDCHLAVLEKTDYVRILSKMHELKIAKKVDFLQDLPMFGKCTRGFLQKLTYYFKEKVYKRKQILFRPGDLPSELLFIQDGEVQVIKDLPVVKPRGNSLFTAHKYTLHAEMVLLGKGETVGYTEVKTGCKHQYTYICRSTTVSVLAITRDDFLKRVNNEDSLKSMHKIAEMKEDIRTQRIGKLSSLELYKGGNRELAGAKHPRSQSTDPLSPTIPRLYPRPSSPVLTKSPLTTLRQRSCTDLFSLFHPKKHPSKRVFETKIVNMHIQNQRNRLAERYKKVYSVGNFTERAEAPLLTVNFVEIVKTNGSESPEIRGKSDRIVGTSHSLFRLQRLSTESTLRH